MSIAARRVLGSERETRSALRDRLEGRRSEIEAATLTRVNAIADSSAASDPTYAEGLRGAVSAAVDYGIATIESGEEPGLPMPVALLAQARIAARSGVSLDTVLRRYFAGYSLLGYFIVEEASKDGLMSAAELQRLLGTQAVVFDRLLAAIGEEHTRESELRASSSGKRHAERIERLLEGELIDTAPISYDFQGWHVGLVASGPGASAGLRELARALDLRPLIVEHGEEEAVWAWLGARREPDPAAVRNFAAANRGADAALAIGEPGSGLDGWRLSHRQAAAALTVALRGSQPIVRYADVALLASVLQDDLLATSLCELFLAPLQGERDGGEVVRATLRAYLASGCNASSTAAALGIARQTVAARLRVVEDLLDRPLNQCLSELDIALRLEEEPLSG